MILKNKSSLKLIQMAVYYANGAFLKNTGHYFRFLPSTRDPKHTVHVEMGGLQKIYGIQSKNDFCIVWIYT